MASTGSSARRYAEALYELASADSAVPAFAGSLDRLRRALAPDTLRALRNPAVPLRSRADALDAATVDEPKAVRSLLEVLLERDRIGLLPQIAAAYVDIVDRRAGIVKGRITTATELDARQRDELVGRLERSVGKRIRATFAVDASLIGGAKVQIGDRLIDASVKAQLTELGREIAR
jgi:F-type H+-transporting ATPase subunit delta